VDSVVVPWSSASSISHTTETDQDVSRHHECVTIVLCPLNAVVRPERDELISFTFHTQPAGSVFGSSFNRSSNRIRSAQTTEAADDTIRISRAGSDDRSVTVTATFSVTPNSESSAFLVPFCVGGVHDVRNLSSFSRVFQSRQVERRTHMQPCVTIACCVERFVPTHDFNLHVKVTGFLGVQKVQIITRVPDIGSAADDFHFHLTVNASSDLLTDSVRIVIDLRTIVRICKDPNVSSSPA